MQTAAETVTDFGIKNNETKIKSSLYQTQLNNGVTELIKKQDCLFNSNYVVVS